jgi:hypothetical protein
VLRRIGLIVLALGLLACAGVWYRRSHGAVVPGLAAPPLATVVDRPLAGDSIALADFAYDRCRLLWGDQRKGCYEEIFLLATERGKVRLAMDALSVLDRKDPDLKRSGHDYTHVVGINAWEPGKDVSAIYEQCTSLYQSGCYHGVVQAYLAAQGTDSTVVAALCDQIAVAHTVAWLRFQCVHGLGHGLVQTQSLHLPKALRGCDWLGTRWDRESCYGGAFMEFILAGRGQSHHPHMRKWAAKGAADHGEHAGHDAGEHAEHQMTAQSGNTAADTFLTRDRKDPLFPCSVLHERYLQSCYGMQAGIIIETAGADFGRIAGACDVAPEHVRGSCYQGIGTYVSGFFVLDPAKADHACSLGSPRWRSWCYVGVVKNFIDVTSRAQTGLDFCRRLTDPQIATHCYVGVGEEMGVLLPNLDVREQECAKAGPTYTPACRYGAALGAPRPRELGPAS